MTCVHYEMRYAELVGALYEDMHNSKYFSNTWGSPWQTELYLY